MGSSAANTNRQIPVANPDIFIKPGFFSSPGIKE
jgi:hypothetical protein